MTGRELQPRDFQSALFPAYLEQSTGNPNPFVAWLNYKRVRKHGMKKLLGGLALCAEVDAGLKRGMAGPLALERLVLAVCGLPKA